jgi:hypothetical protein
MPIGFLYWNDGLYCRTTAQSESCIQLMTKTVLDTAYLQAIKFRVFHNAPSNIPAVDMLELLKPFFSESVASHLIAVLFSAPLKDEDQWNQGSDIVSGNLVLIRDRTTSAGGISETVEVWRRSDLPTNIAREIGHIR